MDGPPRNERQVARDILTTAKFVAGASYSALAKYFPSINSIESDEWDFFATSAFVALAIELSPEDAFLMESLQREIEAWDPHGLGAVLDCMEFMRTNARAATSRGDKPSRDVIDIAVGIWLVRNATAGAPLDNHALAVSAGRFMAAAIDDHGEPEAGPGTTARPIDGSTRPPLVEPALEEYKRQLNDVRAQLMSSTDDTERRMLLEAQEALSFIIPQWESIQDVESARAAAAALRQRIQGFHPAIIAQMIGTSRDIIVEGLLPQPEPIAKAGARDAAIRFLSEEMKDSDRDAIRQAIAQLGLQQFQVEYHMSLGMGVRNRLRERGFNDDLLDASIEDVWASLVHQAVFLRF